MRCQYCTAEAAYAAESGGIRVGLCERHLHEQINRFADGPARVAFRNMLE